MSVKPELAFDVCWESVPRRARSAGDEARHFGAELEGHGEFLVAAGFSPPPERVGGGFALPGQAALDGPDWPRAWCYSVSTTWGLRRMKMRGTFSA